jgi:hypothetical protein
MGWGAGMRRIKVTPQFTKEDKIIKNLREVQEQILNYPEQIYK